MREKSSDSFNLRAGRFDLFCNEPACVGHLRAEKEDLLVTTRGFDGAAYLDTRYTLNWLGAQKFQAWDTCARDERDLAYRKLPYGEWSIGYKSPLITLGELWDRGQLKPTREEVGLDADIRKTLR